MRLRWCMLDQNKLFFTDTLPAADANNNTTQSHIIDLARMASSLNRKHIPNVDRNGNAQVFVVAVKGVTGTDVINAIRTAPNLYTTKAAVKAWHDAREEMITRTGAKMSDLGPYARHLRPFLDTNHQDGTTTEISSETVATGGFAFNTHFQGEEFTRSELAVSVPAKDNLTSSTAMYDLVDTYPLHLCGASVVEPASASTSGSVSDQDSFHSVGMIDSWLTSISKKSLGTADSLRIQSDNPLLQLIADSTSSEEALEIIEESASEGRPWDLDGSQYISLTGAAYFRTNVNQAPVQIIHVPCGLLEIQQESMHSAEEIAVTEFEILDIYDM